MSKKTENANKTPKFRNVSGRDQEIYHQTAVEGQSQRKVATEKKISQSRVSKIVKRVGLWLSETVPFGLAELPREQRLHVAARTHRMKLDWMYHQATEAWQGSKEPVRTRKEKTVKGEKVEEFVVKTQVGNFRLLDGACKIAERQIVFDGFALDGRVEVSCAGRLFEPPAMTDDELLAQMNADYKRLRPTLEEFERKQEEGEREEGENHFATSLATCSGSEETGEIANAGDISEVLSDGLSEISLDQSQEDVTSIPVIVNDARESLSEVLSNVALPPPAHVASDVAKSSPLTSTIANHQSSIPSVPVAPSACHSLSPAPSIPLSPSPPEHVASDVAKSSLLTSTIANHHSSIPSVSPSPTLPLSPSPTLPLSPSLTYRSPLPRYHEADGVRWPMPFMRMIEDPNPKKLPGLWLKVPARYVRSESTGEWVPSG